MPSYSLYLAHYGVKGMKWGVRRAQKKLSRYVGKQTRTQFGTMSDEDLKKSASDLRGTASALKKQASQDAKRGDLLNASYLNQYAFQAEARAAGHDWIRENRPKFIQQANEIAENSASYRKGKKRIKALINEYELASRESGAKFEERYYAD